MPTESPTPGTPATCDPTHRFTGQELDPESGLYYYGGRYYDQEISRFISPDPYVQEPDDPQNLNRYTYVLNNPQGYVDPNGQFFFQFFMFIASIITSIEAFSSTAIIVEGTIVGTNVGNVILGVASLAQAGYWGSQLAKSAELQQLAQNRAVQAQSQNNINNLRSDKLEDPNRGAGNTGNDYPKKEPSWWEKICIGPCDAHAGDEGVKVPPWWPPRGRPGGIAVPGGKNKPIEYRPPTPGQRRHWEDFLNREGRAKLEKEKLTAQKTLEQHYRKLAEIYQKGGYPNPVEQTILRRQNDLEIINDLLSKIPR